LLLAGCKGNSTVNPCAGVTETCIEARVEGTATGLDQLIFSIESPMHLVTKSPAAPQPFNLPVKLGLVVPANATFPLEITLLGMSQNNAIAVDKKTVALGNNVTFTLNGGMAPDLAVPPDMTVLPDLNKPPITLTSDAPDGGTVVYELERISITATASDPLNQTLVMGFNGGPTTGPTITMPTPGNNIKFDWTPGITDAQMYAMQVDVNSTQDVSRTASLPTPLRVKNAFDPVFRLNPNDTISSNQAPTVVVGDFDGDGFADLASCSTSTNNPNAVYEVFVFYPNALGLPAILPNVGTPNYRRYTFSGTSPSSPNARLVCTGGDFDGDGKSDILIGDPSANSPHGMLYLFLGDANRNQTPVVIQVLDNSAFPAGEVIGGNPILTGDFNGDKLIDFATYTVPAPGMDNTYIFSWKPIAPVAGQPIDHSMPPALLFAGSSLNNSRHAAPANHFCQPRTMQAFGDIDNAGGQELLLYDSGVGAASNADCGMPGKGGIAIIKDGVATDVTYLRPAASEPSYGKNSALCDVDLDGFADLVVADGPMNSHAYVQFSNAGIFANTGGSPAVLDGMAGPNVAVIPPTPAGHVWSGASCAIKVTSAFAQNMVLVDPGDASNAIRIDFFAPGRMPMFVRSLPNPTSMPVDLQFGQVSGGSGDINGDGLTDAVLGSKSSLFAAYGR
jgi:hypothetical protein